MGQYDAFELGRGGYGRLNDYRTIRKCLKAFLDASRVMFGTFKYAWFLEFGERSENPHIHLFFEDQGFEYVNRQRERGKALIASCERSSQLREIWIRCSGTSEPERCRKFSSGYYHGQIFHGGAIEKLHCPEGAARYAAKEASKAVQKTSPFPVSQWWRVSDNAMPLKRSETDCSVAEFLTATEQPFMCSRNFGRVAPAPATVPKK